MSEREILEILERHLLAIDPNLSAEEITADRAMRDLVSDSSDWTELILAVMRELSVSISLVELASVPNLGELARRFHERRSSANSGGRG